MIELIITNPRLGEWFSEAGRPVTGEPGPPTPDDLARLIAVSGKYGYRLGTPEENRAAGIHSQGEQDAPDATGIARRHFLPTPSSPVTAQPEARPLHLSPDLIQGRESSLRQSFDRRKIAARTAGFIQDAS